MNKTMLHIRSFRIHSCSRKPVGGSPEEARTLALRRFFCSAILSARRTVARRFSSIYTWPGVVGPGFQYDSAFHRWHNVLS